jgi:hypothetical protein
MISKLKTSYVILLGFLLYFSVLLINDGFMALDEYWVGITRYIPAQSSSLMSLVSTDDVKSPLQLLPMHIIAQASLKIGIVSPYWQYRAVIFVLGAINILMLLWIFFELSQFLKLDKSESNFLFLMLFLYFAAPFSLTRPMFESIAAPWLTWAAVKALKYDLNSKLKDLLWGVFFGSVAFVLRQQLGFCALIFMLLPILKKNWKHLIYTGLLGLLFFVISGIPDYYIRGKFHFSLLNLTLYNYAHGAEYGDRTVFFYPILIFIVAFIPFFIKKYPKEFVFEYLKKYRSLLIILGLFVFLHSLFPQKWERFIISVVPLLIFLVFPFLWYLHKSFNKYKWRLSSLYLINFILFFVASFFPAQKNLIEMSLYLNEHPEIKKIHRVADTPGWITEAFILDKKFEFIESNREILKAVDWTDCSSVFVLGEAQNEEYKEITQNLKTKAEFNVNLIEQLAFKTNPKNNLRRVKLKIYSGCG